METTLLGLIALGVLTMAAIQVAAMVFVARTAGRIEGAVQDLRRDVSPILASLQTMTADAARATAVAAAQVDRVESLVTSLTARIEEAATTIHETVITPARDVLAILRGLGAAFMAFRGDRREKDKKSSGGDGGDEDPLFVG